MKKFTENVFKEESIGRFKYLNLLQISIFI